MSNKGPKTTQFPDWDQLLDDYLDQQERLTRIIDGLRALERDPSTLQADLAKLQQRIDAVEQMRAVIALHQAA